MIANPRPVPGLLGSAQSDDGVFGPTVWMLDVSCTDDVVAVAAAGVLDDLPPLDGRSSRWTQPGPWTRFPSDRGFLPTAVCSRLTGHIFWWEPTVPPRRSVDFIGSSTFLTAR